MTTQRQIRKVVFPVEGRSYDFIGLTLLVPEQMSQEEYEARIQMFMSSTHHQLMLSNIEAFHAVIQFPLERGACPGLSPEILIDQITKVKGKPEDNPGKYTVNEIKMRKLIPASEFRKGAS
jgi:hypothetical protein